MKAVILGSNGQLGQAFARMLGTQAVPLTRSQVDLTKPETISAALADLQPEVVLNCTAYNWVDKAEREPDAALAVNMLGVRDLALVCQRLNRTLVHFSTNYVFGLDETRRAPYTETDLPGPVGVYGASKLAGENLVRASCSKHFVIRTCGLFGLVQPGSARRSFVELMLHLARQGQPIRVVNDQTCAPTYTEDLVRATLHLLNTQAYGVYHLTSDGACTWYEFARTIFEMANVQPDVRPVSTRDFGARARRPAYSVLKNEAYSRLGLPPMPHWKDALAGYMRILREPRPSR